MGSASALEIASRQPDDIEGLIIESGFAHVIPLLHRIGVDLAAAGIQEPMEMGHLSKIASFVKPTLIIHAEFDHIIPFSDGQALYDRSPAAVKFLVKIEGADHNSIFYHGAETYLQAVHRLIGRLA
ncbi:MAG: hypothetical protein ACOZF0_12400 [Thermodesulfobacteriota bacterium]